jgi:hypothetical protein
MVHWQTDSQPIGDGKAKLSLRPKWCLHGLEGEQIIAALEPPSWLTVKPLQWKFQRNNLPEQLTAELVTDAPVGTEGAIRIVTTMGEHRYEAQIQVRVVQEPTTVLRLDKVQIPFTWGICRRGGKEQSDDGKSGATFHRSEAMPVGGVRKDGFFSHPPYIGASVMYGLNLVRSLCPKNPAFFGSGLG